MSLQVSNVANKEALNNVKGSLSVSFSSVQRSSSGEVSGGEKFDKWGSKWKQRSGCSCGVKEERVCFV